MASESRSSGSTLVCDGSPLSSASACANMNGLPRHPRAIITPSAGGRNHPQAILGREEVTGTDHGNGAGFLQGAGGCRVHCAVPVNPWALVRGWSVTSEAPAFTAASAQARYVWLEASSRGGVSRHRHVRFRLHGSHDGPNAPGFRSRSAPHSAFTTLGTEQPQFRSTIAGRSGLIRRTAAAAIAGRGAEDLEAGDRLLGFFQQPQRRSVVAGRAHPPRPSR